jgi:hypothetical protein
MHGVTVKNCVNMFMSYDCTRKYTYRTSDFMWLGQNFANEFGPPYVTRSRKGMQLGPIHCNVYEYF